jgi:hypothetical protein
MATHLTTVEFQNALTPSLLRQMQIIQVAIPAAPLLYLAVVLILEFTLTPAHAGEAMVETLAILSLVHCIFAIVAYGVSFALFNNLFTEQRLRRSIPEGSVSTDLLVNLSLMLLRTGMIMRLAFFEATAFIGLSVCVIAVSTGVINGHPEFWLNCTTTLILAIFSVTTFPTKERVVQLFNEKLASSMTSLASTVPSHT